MRFERHLFVLRIADTESGECFGPSGSGQGGGRTFETEPGEARPIFGIAVEEEGCTGVAVDITEASEGAARLRLLVD